MSEIRARCKTLMKLRTGEEGGTTRIEGVQDEERTALEEVSSKEED